MYLRSLEMQGFKSFPDKTELKFNKGITAVVGPNGSGKSNIADAMRWVMGEQSSKALRGEKMAGVIFHGCDTRKESPFAQVTINIDNSDRALEYDSDIVSVSRKLYRNGESEYLINGKCVKLKEVNELFMDTGLGKDGYSIVGQGRIADIVNGKSNDRREIFEEAAGIAKFRYKKQEAEKKLAAAEENISRLNDILAELESRIGPLEKQCEKAKKFRVLDDEKRQLEISVWFHRLEEYRRRLAEYEEKLRLLEQQYNQISEEIKDAEDEYNRNIELSAARSTEVDELREKIHLTELENNNALSKIAVCENDISHIEENILRFKEQIEQSQSSKYYQEKELEKRQSELRELIERQEKSAATVSDKEKEFDSLIFQAEQSDQAVADVNTEITKAYLKRTNITLKMENLNSSIDEIKEQITANTETVKDLEEKERFTSSELKKLRISYNKALESKQETENRLDGLTKLFDKRREKLDDISAQHAKADGTLREISAKLQMLRDLENNMEGFGRSVKHIMNSVRQGRISGVCGTVAQLITVRSEYSVAIETALGGALQNIVVDNEDAAKRGIRLLKESNTGRATFLPVTSVKGNRLENKQLENENGFVALGCDLVKFDGKFSGIINNLLGRICIAEDVDLAAVIAKKYGYKFRIVTLDGQVINAGGSFTGGSVSRSTGILTRKNEIDEMSAKKDRLESELKELLQKREHTLNEVNKFSADIEGLKEQLNSAGAECIKLEMEIKRVDEFSKQYDIRLDEADRQETVLRSKLKTTENDLADAKRELEETDREIIDGEAKLTVSQSAQSDLKTRRETLSSELSELRIKSAELNKDIQACRMSIEDLNSAISSTDGDCGKIQLEIGGLENQIKDKNREIENIKTRLDGADDVIAELNERIETAQREHLEYDRIAAQIRSQNKNKMDEKETLSTQLTREEERKNSLSADFDKLVSQLWDEYELTRSTAAEIADELEDIPAANKRLTELKNQIKSLGNVNLGAIEEYAEVSERYGFMTSQLNDVNTSKRELCEMIENLTENMKNVFMHSFENINNNFKSIFSELFGGGKAELILTDPENVLECGIEINVQPPGKVITSLMSLSGGEQALVAVAIYFAILKNSPSPFCLLDEIEAALDDVNVTRYAQYLHKLTDKTQFITITHRRGTMEEADVLYGVTMQEKGISKLLRMSVEETRQMKFED